MATYYVSSDGSNTSPYDTWAKAATTLQAAVTLATVAGDIILVDQDHQESSAVALTITWSAAATVICVDKDSSNALSTMQGATGFIKVTGGVNMAVVFVANTNNYFYGINFVHSGTGARTINIGNGSGAAVHYERSRWAIENTGHTGQIIFGGISDQPGEIRFTNTDIVTANAGNRIRISKRGKVVGGAWTIFSGGSVPSYATVFDTADPGAAAIDFEGMDLSALGSASLVGGTNTVAGIARFHQCALGSGYSMLAAGTTPATAGGPEVYVSDCASDDTHGLFGYANMLGSVVSDTGIKYTGGAAGQSWKIVTTSLASFYTPFCTPWINFYHSGTSSITPRFEVLRDGNATAYDNDEIWAEFLVKTISGSTAATLSSDRMAVLGTPAAQASGTDTWDGENATHWAGKVDSGSAVTPAEAGDIRGRVCVGLASATVYVDPYIHT